MHVRTMHELAKSRSSTPQCENINPSVLEALQLLQKWNLLELQSQFKEHDVTLRSLIYLTDEDICELAPKIGTRTIFRAMLKQWRQTCDALTYTRQTTCDLDSDSYTHQIRLKVEPSAEEIDVNDFDTECLEKQNNTTENAKESPTVLEFSNNRSLRNQFNYKEKPIIVLDILNNCTDGQAVLEFYKMHNFLDIKNRKRIVNLLIRHVVERKIEKYTAIFHDMTRQLLQIFPTEKYETYFVPHNGPNSARGALYYRYSNYTRQLRKEGLLAYKKHKPRSSNITKK